ncbi:MAG TPA: alpha/beta hydrolase [Pseudomonadales bacterium]|nr:alpha/beta hydrolase [Pseudomonadales bacterium]
MSTILIVPGLNGSGEHHWQTHWERHLPDTVRVQQDDWSHPDLDQWAANVVETAADRKNIWIVAHSFGVLAAVHALQHISTQVEGVFLVAPADPHKFRVQHQLTQQPLPVTGALVASHSDPWLSWQDAQQLADDWYLPVLDAGDAGHINVASGHFVWQQGLIWFESLRRTRLAITHELSIVGEHFLNVDQSWPGVAAAESFRLAL